MTQQDLLDLPGDLSDVGREILRRTPRADRADMRALLANHIRDLEPVQLTHNRLLLLACKCWGLLDVEPEPRR